MKAIVLIGGGSSEIGKSSITASILYLLKKHRIQFFPIKFDGYLNIDTGKMCKYHTPQKLRAFGEEVFVLKDGTETDSDLGIYERFTRMNLMRDSYITNGEILHKLISRNIKGNGEILTFNNVKEEYKKRINRENDSIIVIEVGGTLGDRENEFFIETLSELSNIKNNKFVFILVAPTFRLHKTDKDTISTSFTKLIRSSINLLIRRGIRPDVVISRSKERLSSQDKEYIISSTGIKNILEIPFMETIYDLPKVIESSNLLNILSQKFRIKIRNEKDNPIEKYSYLLKRKYRRNSKILITDNMESYDSYISLIEGLNHSAVKNRCNIKILWMDKLKNTKKFLKNGKVDGIIILNDYENVKKKMDLLKIARKNNIPTLGISGGMYLMAKEFTEESSININIKHSDFKVGEFKTKLVKGSKLYKIYRRDIISERHRHTEILKETEKLNQTNLKPVGFASNSEVDCIELKTHKFYVGVSFHPEFTSRPLNPNPLLVSFIKSTITKG